MAPLRRSAIGALVVALALLAACSSGMRRPQRGPTIQDGRQFLWGPPAVAGIDGPLAVTGIDEPATPWVGSPPVVRTTADIMAEAARQPLVVAPQDARPFVKIRPDRRGLPTHPDSRPVAQWPPSPRFARDPGSPLFSHTPSTPNVDLATLAETNALPPDTQGDIGPTQYLLGVNGRIRTIDKATGAADGVLNSTFNTFFSSVRNGASTSDPRVRYDRRTNRWFVIMINVAVPNRNLVAVSNGGTITGSTVWSFFQWTNTRTAGGVGGADSCLGDYPTLGVDEDALYVGVNQFCGPILNSLSFDSTSAYVINKASLVGGTLAVAQFDGVLPSGSSAGPYTPQGVDNFAAGTDQGYFIGVDNLSFGVLVVRRVSSPAGSPSLSGNLDITVPTTRFPIDVPHFGGVLPLDGLDDRLLQAVVRNGRLWTTHQMEVDSSGVATIGGGRNGIRWYELQNLNSTPGIAQSGTVFDSSGFNPRDYWMGAIMPNGQGHVALGMSTAGSTYRVNAAVTGRVATDALGSMDTPSTYSNSQFSYNAQSSPDSNQRWGDYSYTSVDPDDDMTMWTLQEYVNGTDSYAVRLVRLLAPPPASIASLTPSTLDPGLTGASVIVAGTSSGGSGFFDPGSGFADRLAASFSGAGVSVTNVAFTSPTSLTLTVDTSGAAPGPRTLTVTNPDGQTSQLASALTIGPNQPPTAVNDSRTTAFGTTLVVAAPGVLVNDTDPESQALTAQLASTTTHGALALNTNGSFTYVPTGGYSGADSFTYRAFDGELLSNVATVSLTVSANQPPTITAPANQSGFDPGTGVSFGPLAFTVNDPEGATITVTRTSSNTNVVPVTGVVLGGSGANRTVTVSTAGASVGGVSTITLTASDGFASTDAIFAVTITRSTPPVAIDDSYLTAFDAPLSVAAPGVLQNDSDVDAQALTAGLVSTTSHGTLSLASNGSFTYTPTAGYTGPDDFTYRASDGVFTSNVATARITVSPNHAPVVVPPANVSLIDTGGGAASGALAFVVSDFEGSPLAVSASSSNQAIVANSGIVLGGSGNNRTVSTTSVPGTVGGPVVITLSASDGIFVTSATFVVTLTPQRGWPQGVTAVVSRNAVTFTWQPPPYSVESVIGYTLDAGLAPGSTFVSLPLGNTQSLTVSAPDGIYFVRLRAQTTGGVSTPSNEVTVATGQAAPPLAPLALLATVQGTGVQLQWTENPLGPVITSYHLRAGHSSGVTDVAVVPFDAATRSVAAVVPVDTYFVRMVAANASGAGSASNEAIVAVGPGICTIPATPTGLQAATGPGSIAVAWSPPSAGAIPTSYQVLAGTAPGLTNLGVHALPGTSTSIGGPVASGPYFIRVVAVNACGASAASAEVSALVP